MDKIFTKCVDSTNNKEPFYGPLIQDNPAEPVLSQRTDLLDFYELDITTLQESQWFDV